MNRPVHPSAASGKCVPAHSLGAVQAVLNGVRYSVRQMAKQQNSELVLVKDPEIQAPSALVVPKWDPSLISCMCCLTSVELNMRHNGLTGCCELARSSCCPRFAQRHNVTACMSACQADTGQSAVARLHGIA